MLLDVATTASVEPADVADALGALARTAGWSAPSPSAVVVGNRRELLGALAADASEAARVGLYDGGLVLAARHDSLDGLAMLTAAGRLVGGDLRSSARGVGTDRRPAAGAAAARAWEVVARPPARVVPSRTRTERHDSFAVTTIAGSPRTADLVHAGAGAVVAWNQARGASGRRVAVAVGVSTVGAASAALADNSAFLRLRGAERLGLDQVRERLAEAPVQPGGGAGAGSPVVAAVATVAVRLAAPRLGSTLLVSHLGTIEAPDDVDGLAFYPVSGGGSGLSLGATTLRGRTTLTLRGRGAQHDDEGLQGLLALVVERLA